MWSLLYPGKQTYPKIPFKLNKYYELYNELIRNIVNLYAVEVGARGITARSLYNLFKDLGLSRTIISSFLESISKAALVGSYDIWLGRERSMNSEGERILNVSVIVYIHDESAVKVIIGYIKRCDDRDGSRLFVRIHLRCVY